MNKDIISIEEMCLVTNKYITLLNKMHEVYCCISSLIVDDNLIEKSEFTFKKQYYCGNN